MEFIEALLHAGAEVNDFNPVRKVSPVHLAVKNGRPESLEILLRYGANVNGREGEGRTALHVLLGQWNREGMENVRWPYLELLVSHLAIDVNAHDNTESTPLELAVRKNLAPVARKLLQAGAVINQHVRSAMQVIKDFPFLNQPVLFSSVFRRTRCRICWTSTPRKKQYQIIMQLN